MHEYYVIYIYIYIIVALLVFSELVSGLYFWVSESDFGPLYIIRCLKFVFDFEIRRIVFVGLFVFLVVVNWVSRYIYGEN